MLCIDAHSPWCLVAILLLLYTHTHLACISDFQSMHGQMSTVEHDQPPTFSHECDRAEGRFTEYAPPPDTCVLAMLSLKTGAHPPRRWKTPHPNFTPRY